MQAACTLDGYEAVALVGLKFPSSETPIKMTMKLLLMTT
jgi:hypothetical protein